MAEQAATAATFLFTDIEGSTQLLKRLRGGYGAVLAQHQQILRQAFAAYGGQEVDTQGDAFFVAFRRAREAVLAAVEAQRGLAAHEWPEEEQPRVRIGIHTGEAAVAENRYVGLSVHRAARICALGRGGQILLSQTTRHVLEDDEEPLLGVELRDLGEHTLKDLARPVLLSEVVFEHEGRASAAPPEPADDHELRTVLPGALALESAFPFVGRALELETLESLLPVGDADRLSVALVSGEPGSGKTRLVRELARDAAGRGILVLYGTSDAVVNSPYKPFVEALDFLVRVLEPELVRGALGTGGGELNRLLPDLSARLGPFPAPVSADPDTERHRLHTAVGELLFHVGRNQPLLLVLDDVHWADPSTLHLLRHLARAADVRMLILAVFRPEEPDSSPELSDTLADLSRLEGMTRLRLTGLEDAEVEEFVRRSTGAANELELRSVALSLEELTEGNPFLLCELWRTLNETGAVETVGGGVRLVQPLAELATPDTVRDVVQYRLARLADTTKALLEVAAVVGAEFELSVLRAAAGLDEQELYQALEEAVHTGTIDEVPGPGLSHRFMHELVRRALADGLTRVRLAELHLAVAEALERVYPDGPARVLPDLAHHFALAAAVAGPERAVVYNVRAAEAASASLAFEDAAARLATALELGVEDDRERARLELERGLAHQRAGQTPEALAAFAGAAEAGRSLDDGEIFARAALGYEDAANQPMATDEGAVVLLREALGRLPEEDSALRARLLSALSRALIFVGAEVEARALRGEATEMARRLGDPATLARILIQEEIRNVHVPREDALERLTEARDLALELRDADVLLEAMWRRVATLAGLGELHEARAECENLRRIAEEARQPVKLNAAALFGSALALADGKLDEAEVLAEEAEEWTRVMRLPTSGEYGVQLFGIRREQGRLEELRPIVELMARSPGGSGRWRPGFVALLVELGMEDEARAELERMRADAFVSVTGALGTAALVYVTDACSALGDAESAAVLYPRLEPLAARTVLIGQLVACYGAADRYLGMLAALLEDWETAEAHFEYARYVNRRTATHTWTAHTAYQYARALLARGRAVDRPRAAELLSEAADLSERFGLVALRRKLDDVRSRPVGGVELPDGLSAREVDVLRLVAHGYSNREIGSRLFISEHTAANHVRSILRKTGCANRTDAASYAHQHGLVGEL